MRKDCMCHEDEADNWFGLANQGDMDDIGKPGPRGASHKTSARPDDGNKTRALDGVTLYFSGIRKFALLTQGEEHRLSLRVLKGDAEARKTMIESNLRLVVSTAKRFLNRGLPMADLIEEGNIGLIRAVERFKPSMGCRFSTYATYWIRQAIDRAVANQANIVRLPIHVTSDISKITRAARGLRAELKREPSVEELSAKTGLSGRYVKKLDSVNRKTYSMDISPSENGEQTLLDKLEDDTFPAPMEAFDDAQREGLVKEWLTSLEPAEKEIIGMRFGFDDAEPATLDSIGRLFGVTRERVRQIEVKALFKLKRLIEEADLTFSDVV